MLKEGLVEESARSFRGSTGQQVRRSEPQASVPDSRVSSMAIMRTRSRVAVLLSAALLTIWSAMVRPPPPQPVNVALEELRFARDYYPSVPRCFVVGPEQLDRENSSAPQGVPNDLDLFGRLIDEVRPAPAPWEGEGRDKTGRKK